MRSLKSIALGLLLATGIPADTIYVSTQGQANWSGKLANPNPARSDGPISSVTLARDRIRELRRSGHQSSMTVVIREGTYTLEKALELGPEDSDETYVAYKGEHPIISGGQQITGWRKTGPNIWTAAVAGGVPTQLFLSGTRGQRSRLPVNGFYLGDGYSSKDASFKFRGSDIKAEWSGSGAEIVSLHNWSVARRAVAAVDSSSSTARLITPVTVPSVDRDVRYWIENIPEPQAPGQWYADRGRASISYWPMAGEVLDSETAIVPKLETLISIQGRADRVARDIAFKGLDFRYTTWSLPRNGFVDNQAAADVPAGFVARAAERLLLDHCTFSNLGGYAVWFGRGAKNNTISHAEIFDAGGGGVKFGETQFYGSAADQTENNTVIDNEMHDLGLVYPSAVAIWIGWSAGNTVSHNDLHDLPYSAISVGWTWGYGPSAAFCHNNTIENNHIHEIGKGVMSDMGGIYTLGPQSGTVIRNNLIHDVTAFEYGGWGIYADEGSSNLLIEDNIVYRTSSASLHENYGQNNVIRNNIFAYGKDYQIMLGRAEPHLSFALEQNIIVYSSGRLLKGIFESAQVSADRNIYWDARGSTLFRSPQWSAWRNSGHDIHSVVGDPFFINAAGYDFHLQPNSPALALGFHPIDVSQVGTRGAAGAATFEGAD